MKMQRIHLFVEGRVQGVGFRHAAYQKAIQLGLKGWVRNTPSGKVEIVAQGKDLIIDELISWCFQGPPSAVVERVEIARRQAVDEDGTFFSFEIRH